jgi:protein gp37
MGTNIEWCRNDDGTLGKVWNPTRGCSLVSAGCQNCYAMRQAHRFSGKGQPYEGLTRLTKHGPVWTGEVRCVPEMLSAPLQWRKPCRVFVNSMSDIFHPDVPNEFIAAVFGVMAACQQHTFVLLTKQAARMRELFSRADAGFAVRYCHSQAASVGPLLDSWPPDCTWPLPNVILGVSAENQAAADERIPDLLATPAACRMVSVEPMLGPVDLWTYLRGEIRDRSLAELKSQPMPGLDWVIVGCESGAERVRRPMDTDWARALRDQCRTAGVPFFYKQQVKPRSWDGAEPARLIKMPLLDGRVWAEMPDGCRNTDREESGA